MCMFNRVTMGAYKDVYLRPGECGNVCETA